MSGATTYSCYAVKRSGLARSLKVSSRLFSALSTVAQNAARSLGSIGRLSDVSGVNCASNNFCVAAGRNAALSASGTSVHGFEGNAAAAACADPSDCIVV